FRQVDHRVFLAYLHEHLLAVERDFEIAHIAQDRLLPVFKAVGTKMPAATVRAAIIVVIVAIVCDRPAHIEDTIVNQAQVRIVSRSNVERDEPIVQAVEVHFHWFLRLGILLLLLVVLLGVFASLLLRPGLVFVCFLAFVFILVLVVGFLLVLVLILLFFLLLTDFIAPRAKRIFGLLCQRHQINALQV